MIKATPRTPFWLLLLALAGAGGWLFHQQGAGPDPQTLYRFEPVTRGDLTQSVAANGTLNPVSLVNVGTQVSGTVRRLYVDFNDRVEQGQLLLELDDAVLAAQVKQSEANVRKAAAELELARAKEARLRDMHNKAYLSRQELEIAEAESRSAAAQLDLARAQLEKDQANLGYTRIRSPVAGVVVDRVVDVGQTVAASFQTPVLIKIARDLTKMQIDTSFAEADIGGIRVGQSARFNVDAFPDRAFEGSVRQVRLNPTSQQNVVTYNVVVTVENPDLILLPGMTAYVKIAVADRKQALLLPNAALRFRPEGEEAPARAARGEGAGRPEGEAAARGNGRSGEGRSGEGRSGEGRSGEGRSGEGRSGEGRSGKGREKGAGQGGTVWLVEGERLVSRRLTLGVSDGRYTELLGEGLAPGQPVIVGRQQAPAPASRGGVQLRWF